MVVWPRHSFVGGGVFYYTKKIYFLPPMGGCPTRTGGFGLYGIASQILANLVPNFFLFFLDFSVDMADNNGIMKASHEGTNNENSRR
jgi:hypothetical protein